MIWGGLIVADMLALVQHVGLVGDTDGDMQLAEVLQSVALAHDVNLPQSDAQLLAAVKRYGRATNCHCRASVLVVDGGRAGLSAGPAGVIESDGEQLVLAAWDMGGRHSTVGWLPPGVVSLGKGVH